jgi:hypothetical protein
MKKKILYICLLTVAYMAAVGWALLARWGIPLAPGNFSRIAAAFRHDGLLVIIAAFGGAAYLALLVKVFRMPVAAPAVTYGPSDSVYGEPLLEPQGRGIINPGDRKWQEMYGPRRAPKPTELAALPQASGPALVQGQDVEPLPAQGGVPAAMPPYPAIAETAPSVNTALLDAANHTADRISVETALLEHSYSSLGRASIGGEDMDFVAIADSDMIVLGVIDSSAGTISVDGDYWYSEDKRYKSPLRAVSRARAAMLRVMGEVLPKGHGVEVSACVVLPRGRIVNMGALESDASGSGVGVASPSGGGQGGLPGLFDLLPDRSGAKVMEDFEDFAKTLLGYFGNKPAKKAA